MTNKTRLALAIVCVLAFLPTSLFLHNWIIALPLAAIVTFIVYRLIK